MVDVNRTSNLHSQPAPQKRYTGSQGGEQEETVSCFNTKLLCYREENITGVLRYGEFLFGVIDDSEVREVIINHTILKHVQMFLTESDKEDDNDRYKIRSVFPRLFSLLDSLSPYSYDFCTLGQLPFTLVSCFPTP